MFEELKHFFVNNMMMLGYISIVAGVAVAWTLRKFRNEDTKPDDKSNGDVSDLFE